MSEFDDTSDMTDDECRQMLRVVAYQRDTAEHEIMVLHVLLSAIRGDQQAGHWHKDIDAAMRGDS